MFQIYKDYNDLIVEEPKIVAEVYAFEEYQGLFKKELNSFLVLAEDETMDRQVLEAWMGMQRIFLVDKEIAGLLDNKIIFEVSSLKNAEILKQSEEQIVVSSRLSSLFMGQMASASDIKDVLLDLISVEGDNDFTEHDIETNGVCDLQVIRVSEFFDTADNVEFLSKQDLVCNVYDGTNGEYIPLGVICNGSAFMFTNGGRDSKEIVKDDFKCTPNMSDGILIEGDGEGMYYQFQEFDYSKSLKVRPNDYLFVAHRVNGVNVDIEFRYI